MFYFITLVIAFGTFVALILFKKEMSKKMEYKDYIEDAIDGIEKNFASNKVYANIYTKGISFRKDSKGNIEVISQSKLCGTSIKY